MTGPRRIATIGMTGPAGHYCRNPDCGNGRRAGDLLCRDCWHRVPRALRLSIWQLADQAPGSGAHLRACAAALREMLDLNYKWSPTREGESTRSSRAAAVLRGAQDQERP